MCFPDSAAEIGAPPRAVIVFRSAFVEIHHQHAAATLAAFAESVLGATLEGRGVLHNDALNFINTGLGAALAFLITRTLESWAH
mgnify:CR=1 FL=1